MAAYQRIQKKFAIRGLNLNAALDNIPDGQAARLTNVRANQFDALTTRPSLGAFLDPGAGAPLHSLRTFVDAGVARYVSGASTALYLGTTLVDNAYSGDPLSFVAYQPTQAVTPFLYVGDRFRQSKLRSDGVRYNWGIAPPGSPVDADLIAPLYSVISEFETDSGWTAAGIAGTLATALRVPVTTSIAGILYDVGTTGWASVAFTASSYLWLTKGARIVIITGATPETATISEMIPAVLAATTTIAAIAYDSGTTGPCCIVLTNNTTKLERNSLLKLNTGGSAEFVRVLSVAEGDDNSISFRCSTTGAHAAAEVVTAYDCARMYFAATHGAGDVVTGNCVTVGMTVTPPATSGVGTITFTSALDLSKINGRPVTADDWMHISLSVDTLANITMIRILLDVDQTTNDFTKNYYYAEITSNISQGASTGSQSVGAAQSAAVQQAAIQTQITNLQQQIEGYAGAPAYMVTSLQQQLDLLQGSLSPAAYQLDMGASQWSEVFIPIASILAGRVGADATRSLATVKKIRIEVTCTGTVNIGVDSWWIGGTYGPSAPQSINPLNPIKYAYRYRSTITGAKSTWSPLNRGGLFPERQGIVVTGAYSTDPQVDNVDIARVGASINGIPQVVTSIPNSTAGGTWSFTDRFSDAALQEQIEQVDHQPWPVQQLPIGGTCNVVGTTVFAASVPVPANLCVGTLVIVNGVTTIIRGAPATVAGVSSFQVEDNVTTGTAVPFEIGSPTTYGNPLPYLAGAYDETFFAAGDPLNPGRLYWSNRMNPDGAATANYVDLTNATEPILGVCLWNGYVVAMTSERFFAGTVSGNAINPYAFTDVRVGAGLFSPWAFTTGPAIYFLSRGGIMATELGPAQSLTDADLYPFFPHGGQAGVAVNGYLPPNFAVVQYDVLRLTWAKNGWLYLDYQDTAGYSRTLSCNLAKPGWWIDFYETGGAALHYQDESAESFAVLVGCWDGAIRTYGTAAADANGAIHCEVLTPAHNFGDFRARKQWGDAFVDTDASAAPIACALLADNLSVTLATATLSGAESVNRVPVDIAAGLGSKNVNAALDFTWTGAATLYGYELSALPKIERTALRTTDWIDLGQSRWLQGLRVTADTGGAARTVLLEYDGYPLAGGFVTLTMDHDGELQLPYSFTPVFAHRIRLTPTDGGWWELFAVEPIGPLAPEAVTVWQPQPTAHGMSGYQHVREIRAAVLGTGTCIIAGACEFGSISKTVALTGAMQKVYLPVPPNKGMLYSWSILGGPVRVFQDEFEVVVKPWGDPGPYRVVRPFGEGSTEGARI
jgi:hypothetical protein